MFGFGFGYSETLWFLIDCVVYGSPSICYNYDERVNLSSSGLECLYIHVAFSVLSTLDNNKKFVAAISKTL